MTDNALVILDATERAAPTDCEATIERGLQTFVEVGTALLTIRDDGSTVRSIKPLRTTAGTVGNE